MHTLVLRSFHKTENVSDCQPSRMADGRQLPSAMPAWEKTLTKTRRFFEQQSSQSKSDSPVWGGYGSCFPGYGNGAGPGFEGFARGCQRFWPVIQGTGGAAFPQGVLEGSPGKRIQCGHPGHIA